MQHFPMPLPIISPPPRIILQGFFLFYRIFLGFFLQKTRNPLYGLGELISGGGLRTWCNRPISEARTERIPRYCGTEPPVKVSSFHDLRIRFTVTGLVEFWSLSVHSNAEGRHVSPPGGEIRTHGYSADTRSVRISGQSERRKGPIRETDGAGVG